MTVGQLKKMLEGWQDDTIVVLYDGPGNRQSQAIRPNGCRLEGVTARGKDGEYTLPAFVIEYDPNDEDYD